MVSIRSMWPSQSSLCGIESVNKDAVQSEISHEHGISMHSNPMRVRTVLAFLVGAELALVADIRGGGAELAVVANRKHHDIAGTVVCDEDVLAGLVERQITGILPKCRKLVQNSKLPVLLIDGKGAYRAGLTRFIRGVQGFSAGIHRHRRRIRPLRTNALGR